MGELKKGLHKLMDDQPKNSVVPQRPQTQKVPKTQLSKARKADQSPILIQLPELATVRDRVLG